MAPRLPFRPLLRALPGLAAAVFAAPGLAQSPSADLGGSLMQMLAGLAVVIVLLFASLWLLKRLSAPRGPAGDLLKVVSATAVGPRERVVIVELGDTWLVLGVAPGRVSTLHELPRIAGVAAPAAGGDFPDWLKKVLERRHGQ